MQVFWLLCTAKYSKPRSVMSVMVGPSLPPCRGGGVPVHHDPMHGIVTNPGNREQGQSPFSFFVVCDNPVHRVLVNWDPPISQVIDLPGGIQKGNASIPYTIGSVLQYDSLCIYILIRYEGSKTKRSKIAQQVDLLPDLTLDVTKCAKLYFECVYIKNVTTHLAESPFLLAFDLFYLT